MSMHVLCTTLPLSLFIFFTLSLSDPRANEVHFLCTGSQLPPTTFIPTFTKEMNSLSQILNTQSFGTHNTTVTSTTPRIAIYSLAQCYNDLSHTDCLLCYAAGRTKLPRCLPSSSARIYLDGCFLRYDNYSFFHEYVDHARDAVNCSDESVVLNGVNKEFVRKVGLVLKNVTETAVRKGGGFGVVERDGVYALAQCWKSVSVDGCRECLGKASDGVRKCGVKKEGRAMNAGCFLRYSTVKFYNDGNEDEDDDDDNGKSDCYLSRLAIRWYHESTISG